MFVVIGILIGLGAGAALAFIGLYALTGSRLAAARRTRQLLLTDARREADAMRRETQIEAREQSVKLRAEVEQEVSQRRAEIIKIEERVLAKEDEIDGKLTELTRREQGVSDRETHSSERASVRPNGRRRLRPCGGTERSTTKGLPTSGPPR